MKKTQKSLQYFHLKVSVGGRPAFILFRLAKPGYEQARNWRYKKKPSIEIEGFIGWKTGFEPATSGTTIQRSNQLSYNHRDKAVAKLLYFGCFIKIKVCKILSVTPYCFRSSN